MKTLSVGWGYVVSAVCRSRAAAGYWMRKRLYLAASARDGPAARNGSSYGDRCEPVAHHPATVDRVFAAFVNRRGPGRAAGVSCTRHYREPATEILFSSRSRHPHQFGGADLQRGGGTLYWNPVRTLAGAATVAAGGEPGHAIQHSQDCWSCARTPDP